MEYPKKKNIAMISRRQKSSSRNMVETLSRRRLLDPSWEGTRERHDVLVNEIASNHRLQHYTTRLYRTSQLTSRRNDHLPAIFNTTTCATYCFQKYLAWAAASGSPQWPAFEELREIAASTISSKKKNRFRSISAFLGFHKTSSRKYEEGDNHITNFDRQLARWISIQIHPKRLETRKIQCVQRSINTRNQRNGQPRAVRTWRNSQNNSVSHVLATFQRRDSLLRVR